MWGGGISFEFCFLFLLIFKCVCREEGPADTEGRRAGGEATGSRGKESGACRDCAESLLWSFFPFLSCHLSACFLFLFSPLSPHLKYIEEWSQMATPPFSRNIITT